MIILDFIELYISVDIVTRFALSFGMKDLVITIVTTVFFIWRFICGRTQAFI